MNTRRTFMRGLAALAAGLGLRKVATAGANATSAGLTLCPHGYIDVGKDGGITRLLLPGAPEIRNSPWRLAAFEVEGVAGETCFSVGCREVIKVFIDGEDVTNTAYECDAVGGWVNGYEHGGHSLPLAYFHRIGNVRIERTGKPAFVTLNRQGGEVIGSGDEFKAALKATEEKLDQITSLLS